jgi:hypothetical protein
LARFLNLIELKGGRSWLFGAEEAFPIKVDRLFVDVPLFFNEHFRF